MLLCLQVEAIDADKGDNAEVEYSLVTSPSSPESFFSIDRTTGQLTTLKVGWWTDTRYGGVNGYGFVLEADVVIG